MCPNLFTFKNVKLILTLSLLILVSISQRIYRKCSRPTFPKIIGGSNGHSKAYIIEYNPASRYIVASGTSKDAGIHQFSSLYLPPPEIIYVVLYKDPIFMAHQWSKAILLPNHVPREAVFNKDGTILMIALVNDAIKNPTFMFFRTIDGSLLT